MQKTLHTIMVLQSEWDEWYDKVYGYFYRRLDSRYDTEELTAQTLTAYFMNAGERSNPNAYMWGIARNQLNTFIKKKMNNPYQAISIESDYLENIADDTTYSKHYSSKMEALKQCIANHLIARDQEIVRLSIQEDFSSVEVAAHLSMTSTAVRSRLARAIKKLKEQCRTIWLEN